MRQKQIFDIIPPGLEPPKRNFFNRPKESSETNPKIIIREAPAWPRYLRLTGTALLILIGGGLIIMAIGFADLKNSVTQSAPKVLEKFNDAKSALANLETTKATDSLLAIDSEIKAIKARADRYGLVGVSEFLSLAWPKLKDIPQALKGLIKLSESSIALTLSLEELKNESPAWLIGQKGELLVENLERLQAKLEEIAKLAAFFKNRDLGTSFSLLGDDFLAININLVKAQKALRSLTAWINSPAEKHFLILFQNPSELRPAGGFLGSYAEFVLTNKGLRNLIVWDIYDPDGQLDLKIIPPKPLQGITARWGARDANWFFDFPTSAEKILSLLERSKIYSEEGTVFDGALALNINVLETLLGLLGPIELPEYNLALTPVNFLPEIQREVEAGQDNRAGEPKRILKKLTPIILEKITALTPEGKNLLFKSLKEHLKEKDIMVYFRDWEIENYLVDLGAAGEIINLPENFNGDYLAVVNANIGGGKSDAFVTQKIKLSSKIDEYGRIDNFLVIEKTHAGQNQRDLWYRKTNNAYFKIFTPLGSRLTFMKGNETKEIRPVVDYRAPGYLADAELQFLEATSRPIAEFKAEALEEFGKTVFASWFRLGASETKKLEVQYFNPKKLTLGENPIPYQFVFEKQSGAKTSFDLLLEAPPGYLWQETGNENFNYVNENPEGRVIINLTLVSNPAANQR